jgi:hypothetical protein
MTRDMSRKPIKRVPTEADFEALRKDAGAAPSQQGAPEADTPVARRARRAGKSIQQVLADDRLLLRSSGYPTPDCLEPHDIELFARGELPDDRLAHRATCPSCQSLLSAIGADKHNAAVELSRMGALLAGIAGEAAPALPAVAVAAPSRGRVSQGWAVADALAVCALPAVVAIVGLALLWGPARPDTVATQLAAAGVTPLVLLTVLGGVVLALIAAVSISRGFPRPTAAWDRFGGSLLSGTILTIVVAIAVWRVGVERQRRFENALASALAVVQTSQASAVALPMSLPAVAGTLGVEPTIAPGARPAGSLWSAPPNVVLARVAGGARELQLSPSDDSTVGERLAWGTLRQNAKRQWVLADKEGVERPVRAEALPPHPPAGLPHVGLLDAQHESVIVLVQITTAAASRDGAEPAAAPSKPPKPQ